VAAREGAELMSTTKLESTNSYWLDTEPFPTYESLSRHESADVVVVGGGITGLTTAYLLTQAGRKVVLLERGRCASVDSGLTSAHLTMVTDARLSELAKRFGRNHAQAAWDAGLAAIATIEEISREHGFDAGFEWVPGYLHTPVDAAPGDEDPRLQDDATLATELGFDAAYEPVVPLMGRAGVRVDGQARLHPRRYLAGVARSLTDAGGRIFEDSAVTEFMEQPRRVRCNDYLVDCDDVVIATHNPRVGMNSVAGATLFQTKLALYTSYVIGARVGKGVVPDALWWDTADPYRYLRVQPHDDHDLVIFGGQDHKTGQQSDTRACHARLERDLEKIVPGANVEYRWSGQVIETPDGLPYIGSSADHQYSATGFAGNGLTFGTLAAMMITDAITGRPNPWAELFDPSRKAVTRGLWEYLKENVDYPYYMIRDRFAGAETRSLRSIRRGEGAVLLRDGKKIAVYRDPAGQVTQRSAVCTHMGCVVGWNPAERTWDCPCHGSRFKPEGAVISGPAEAPLPAAD
jgi:glycine/D-amino acid oxidase-like deaminating enzyme/nitrite reductase/ring-hydroxylating ferredoxin subunit